MVRNNSNDSHDYDQDYQRAAHDYAEMGPLWAELVFPDDFEALKALYGQRASDQNSPQNRNHYDDDRKGYKR